jgi:hypothetical protein
MGTFAAIPGMFGIWGPAGGGVGCCAVAAPRCAGRCGAATASPLHVTTIAAAIPQARVATFVLFI